jgi:light-regulated signal transduction histidine kinase (bacteriophytochrome)
MVTSFLQLLERRYEGQLDATAQEYIGYAVDGARRMQRLIQDLLAYSRVGTRGQDLGPVDAGEVVLDVLHDLGAAIAETGATVEGAGTLPVVLADATQLHQLFLNLIGNALKFRRPDEAPRIRIEAAPTVLDDGRPAWRFSVSDTGIGLDPQYRERIFQVFQRLHTRDEYEGTGIGLAICKKIVERHGGTIDVESASGQGATFSFTLPFALPAPRSDVPS